MSNDRRYRTECDRCSKTLAYRFGAEPEYCDRCIRQIVRHSKTH